ncbi:MAG: type II CAAX prenyl endopeptidase Rce1 family protein [Promethearchaeota archaeon]
MSKENEGKIKYCVYCGSRVPKNEIYCPNCGKLIIKLQPSEESIPLPAKPEVVLPEKLTISRKCPGCGSIITSTILNQCPICNTVLEKIPEDRKISIQKKPGLIFTNKKLELESKFILKKDTWNLKEGLNVFGTCIYVYLIVFFLLFTILTFQTGSTSVQLTIQMFLLSQLPELLFAIYPIWYIYSKKHSFKKIGFVFASKKIIFAVIFGILGAALLVLVDLFSNSIINFFSDIGLDFFNIEANLTEQNQVIRGANFLWVLLLVVLLCIGAASTEIVFRGVLHNTLKQKFNKDIYVILIVALAYSALMLLFYYPSFFLLNFFAFIVLGIIYELTNRNIFSTIIANIAYNIILIIVIYL